MIDKWFLFSSSSDFWKPLLECQMHTIELFGAVLGFAYMKVHSLHENLQILDLFFFLLLCL